MHSRGVTCTDCHNPHTGKQRAPGNAVCAQCHAPTRFDVAAHTLHPAGSPGAQCAACHMPTRDYMGIDARHDHSMRIPRPDLSAQLGSPNACTACHKDRDAAWAAAVIEKAFGPERKGFQTFGAALQAGRTGAPGASEKLMGLARDPLAPAIARATALTALEPYLSPTVLPTIEAGLADPDPMVRGAALEALQSAPPMERTRLAIGLIDDPSRIVRIKAARVLAIVENKNVGAGLLARLEKVFAEYIDSQRANADRPEAHINLGLFYTERRDPIQAEAEYRAALALDPDFVPAYVNLADLYRTYNRESDAEATLNGGLQKSPRDADLSHALGLLRVRQGRVAEALPLLAQAASAAPDNQRYVYVYGVALHDSGQAREGIAVLEKASQRFPNNPQLLYALAGYTRDAGDARRAEAYRKRLEAIAPTPAGQAR
jgi:predicted CXXCH cytochrome family protein